MNGNSHETKGKTLWNRWENTPFLLRIAVVIGVPIFIGQNVIDGSAQSYAGAWGYGCGLILRFFFGSPLGWFVIGIGIILVIQKKKKQKLLMENQEIKRRNMEDLEEAEREEKEEQRTTKLMDCPDCGKQVSTRASVCIGCGAPLDG
jgi:hypothetical protein